MFSCISYLQHSATTNTSIDSLFSELLNAWSFTFISAQCWSVFYPEDKNYVEKCESLHKENSVRFAKPQTHRQLNTHKCGCVLGLSQSAARSFPDVTSHFASTLAPSVGCLQATKKAWPALGNNPGRRIAGEGRGGRQPDRIGQNVVWLPYKIESIDVALRCK